MSDLADAAELLEAERKRLKAKPVTREQRARQRAARAWWKNLERVWDDAYLLTDDELQWLAQVTDATRDKPARISRNPWTGGRTVRRPPTSREDAVRLEELQRLLRQRESEERDRHRREARKQLAERLARLGMQADRYTSLGAYAALDRYRESLHAQHDSREARTCA